MRAFGQVYLVDLGGCDGATSDDSITFRIRLCHLLMVYLSLSLLLFSFPFPLFSLTVMVDSSWSRALIVHYYCAKHDTRIFMQDLPHVEI